MFPVAFLNQHILGFWLPAVSLIGRSGLTGPQPFLQQCKPRWASSRSVFPQFGGQLVPLLYFSLQLAGFSTAAPVSAVPLATSRTGRLGTLLIVRSLERLTQRDNSSFFQPLKTKKQTDKQLKNKLMKMLLNSPDLATHTSP